MKSFLLGGLVATSILYNIGTTYILFNEYKYKRRFF